MSKKKILRLGYLTTIKTVISYVLGPVKEKVKHLYGSVIRHMDLLFLTIRTAPFALLVID